MNKFNEWCNKEETIINKELFKKHFNFQRPSDILKYLYQTNDKEKNHELVNIINSGLEDLSIYYTCKSIKTEYNICSNLE